MAEDFKPGLEGVVAVETEIAEPDREGGVLRYRGVDITELVGNYPYENVWGLLVDNDLSVTMPEPEHEPVGLTEAPDLQAETAAPGGGSSVERSRPGARISGGSAQMMGTRARWRARRRSRTRSRKMSRGEDCGRALAPVARRSRPEGEGIDTYWICTAEHGLNASTFTAHRRFHPIGAAPSAARSRAR